MHQSRCQRRGEATVPHQVGVAIAPMGPVRQIITDGCGLDNQWDRSGGVAWRLGKPVRTQVLDG